MNYIFVLLADLECEFCLKMSIPNFSFVSLKYRVCTVSILGDGAIVIEGPAICLSCYSKFQIFSPLPKKPILGFAPPPEHRGISISITMNGAQIKVTTQQNCMPTIKMLVSLRIINKQNRNIT